MPAGAALTLLALLPQLALPHMAVQNPFHPFKPNSRVEVRTYRSRLDGGFTLVQVRDNFSGSNACRLDGRGVKVAGGVATFSFGHGVDTANAAFRVDSGPVRTAGEVAQEAAGLGAPFLGGNLNNPSDGRVYIPWSKLTGAERVDIRPNPKSYHRTFVLGPLAAALAQARTQGCSDLSA